jgi:exodeoxyribonuclease VII small subunit
MTDDTNKIDFAASVKKLEAINQWFQNEDFDLDEGLRKLKEGKDLIAKCRQRLQSVENEFIKIKQEFSQENTHPGSGYPNGQGQHQPHGDGEIDPENIPF